MGGEYWKDKGVDPLRLGAKDDFESLEFRGGPGDRWESLAPTESEVLSNPEKYLNQPSQDTGPKWRDWQNGAPDSDLPKDVGDKATLPRGELKNVATALEEDSQKYGDSWNGSLDLESDVNWGNLLGGNAGETATDFQSQVSSMATQFQQNYTAFQSVYKAAVSALKSNAELYAKAEDQATLNKPGTESGA